jgi:isopentenyl-diphosphate delta-isomerase
MNFPSFRLCYIIMEIMIPLVDEQGTVQGFAEKMEVHRKGLLHLAFSVLIFNEEGEMLIHKRADEKYHSAGLWTNACCGHPYPQESLIQAAERRLEEEMGFRCELSPAFQFSYQTLLENGLIENEVDQVFVGTFNGSISPDPAEVSEYKWIPVNTLLEQVKGEPQRFTFWFKKILSHQYGSHGQ